MVHQILYFSLFLLINLKLELDNSAKHLVRRTEKLSCHQHSNLSRGEECKCSCHRKFRWPEQNEECWSHEEICRQMKIRREVLTLKCN